MVYTWRQAENDRQGREDDERAQPEAMTQTLNWRERCYGDDDDFSDEDILDRENRRRYRRRLERDRYFTQAIDPSSLSSPSPPPTSVCSNMSTTAAGNKLAQEIHDEFLTCKICLEGFKSPKCLDCLHTFCEQCIDNHVLNECSYKKYSDYREFTCPLCRKRTQLPIGGVKKLPDNFLVSSLGEVVARQKPSKFPFCDICKLVNRKHREATSKCLDCNKLLCKQCVDMHKETKVTQNHSLFDVEIEKDIECKEHQDEVVRFYCEPCQTCICVLCTFNEHKDHEISQFNDAVNKYKENIQDLLGSCKSKIDIYDRQLALLNKCEGVIKSAEQKIHDAAIQFIAEIRNKEKALIDELHDFYGAELMTYVTRKNEMQNNLDGLKSTCSLTELVLKGKDIELLLLKKQVQEKLSAMANVELKDLPRTVGKQVCFVSGSLDLGRLEDPDAPIDKKKELQRERDALEDSHRLTLPNMLFGQKGIERDIIKEVIKSTPKRTTDTQTDPMQDKASTKSLVNRCIQTEYPERYDREDSSASSSNRGSLETRGTGTDVIFTNEKAVNTPTRSLHSMSTQIQGAGASKEISPSTFADGSTDTDSAVLRRQRRRRERKAVEVSVRPTTSYRSTAPAEGLEDMESFLNNLNARKPFLTNGYHRRSSP
ncbi:tripartite motif-containing protein 45-like isoform X1 [Biomphalaria glabrata]|uniref:Tripartite motif-containing protein 45-like isoform X1 n=1 Tax=Biomphalaria glabrata TaxID=6526 RepID=A0A9W2YGP8_BIOGL|nr:tripartite motif-containing protein 45-like isoform X1 [Biomphalaria glabrata]